ncbi:MAG: alanine--tRNA ligase [Candidatus Staskawiczbacteria bacterium]|nr:alanine--tRNA ligase [Candidatus Staskawiczbacteria bacterium]MBI3337562.1 alanine--tRNA ligase [Candidatus Staskawiczbacteria bacterium]
MQSDELRQKFLQFFKKNGHKIVPSSSLLPSDSSVLFTTAGMQQFKPYYLGEESPYGKNVVSCQKCIRTSDIDEVGDERHLTFFEMLGNFSFGGYFKEEAIKLAHEFIVKELGLKIDYVTVFKGDKNVPPDEKSEKIWKEIDLKIKIKREGIDNFWGPTGEEGPCGPTTEIYVSGIEIWNIVFNEFFCDKNKKLTKLETPGVDTGMGLERLAMVVQKKETVFETDLFEPIIKLIPEEFDERKKRIIADHARAISFLISDGVKPSNKEQGYILRRLIRRIVAYEFISKVSFFEKLIRKIGDDYKLRWSIIDTEFDSEKKKFLETLERGIAESGKVKNADIKSTFLLYQSYGLPYDIIKEFFPNINEKEFNKELKKHQELSKTASAGMFKGGLADDKPETIKLHTAHHLLLAALQEVFGKTIKQRGSNITSERLRIDFSFDRKLTDEEKKKVEDIVNEKIKEGFLVVKREMPKEEAQKIGAEMEFGVKYGNTVSVYFIQDKKGNVFSKEFCGGSHVNSTDELAAHSKVGEPRPESGRGPFKIIKEESLGSGIRRIKAILK